MIAFFSLFTPPVLATFFYLKNNQKEEEKLETKIFIYAFFLLLINVIMFVILTTLKKDNNLIYVLNNDLVFSVKYICISIIIGKAIENIISRTSFKWHTNQRPLKNKYIYLYAFLLIIMNFILCFNNNFWGDEAFTVKMSKVSFNQMINITAKDVHPPLYYIIVQIFTKVFGNKGSVYHFISFIPYILLMIFSITIIKKKWGKTSTLIFITLISLIETALIYNVEARMYSYAALFVFLSFYFLLGILEKNKWSDYLKFAIMSLLAAYTHYYALLSVAFLYLGLVVFSIFSKNKKYLLKSIVTAICTLLGYLPWLFVFINSFKNASNNFWIGNIPSFRQSLEYIFLSKYSNLLCTIFILSSITYLLYESKILNAVKKDNKYFFNIDFSKFCLSINSVWLSIGIFSIISTIATGILVSKMFRPLFILRYIYPVSVLAWFILATNISKLKYKRTYTIIILIIILMGTLTSYKENVIDMKKSNDVLNTTLQKTTEINSEHCIIYTPIRHIGWSIAGYYYPNAKVVTINDEIPSFNEDKDNYLILNEKINEDFSKKINKVNYEYKNIVDDGILGTIKVYIYHLKRIENTEKNK